MSSWNSPLKQVKYKSLSKNPGYFYQTTEAGFCSLFNTLFYDWLFCEKNKMVLYCLDKPNPLGLNYAFFQNILEEKNYLQYISAPNPTLLHVPKKEKAFYLYSLTSKEIRKKAKEFFTWKPEIKNHLPKLPSKETPTIGIHIRAGDKITTGEMKKINIDSYIDAVIKYGKDVPKNIFIMSDTFQNIEEFKKKVLERGLCWHITHSPAGTLQEHVQADFNKQSFEVKQKAFLQFLAEIEIVKSCPVILCTMSSNVGRWLYMTADSIQNFHSLDVEKFSPI